MRSTRTSAATAQRVWDGMRILVLERYDRRQEVCDALDMSFARARALRRIAAEPMTMRELAAKLATDAPYTTVIVDDLERRGLVRRTAHPSDRRAKVVTATEAGARAAAVAERILDQPPPPVRDLDPSELALLDRILTKLLQPPPSED